MMLVIDLYNSLEDCDVDILPIGDDYCDDYPPYNTEECALDGLLEIRMHSDKLVEASLMLQF